MYKVLKEVMDERLEGQGMENEVRVGGRVKSTEAKEKVARQLQKGIEEFESGPKFNVATGELKIKKTKKQKERSPEENALKDCKAYSNKPLVGNKFIKVRHPPTEVEED